MSKLIGLIWFAVRLWALCNPAWVHVINFKTFALSNVNWPHVQLDEIVNFVGNVSFSFLWGLFSNQVFSMREGQQKGSGGQGRSGTKKAVDAHVNAHTFCSAAKGSVCWTASLSCCLFRHRFPSPAPLSVKWLEACALLHGSWKTLYIVNNINPSGDATWRCSKNWIVSIVVIYSCTLRTLMKGTWAIFSIINKEIFIQKRMEWFLFHAFCSDWPSNLAPYIIECLTN